MSKMSFRFAAVKKFHKKQRGDEIRSNGFSSTRKALSVKAEFIDETSVILLQMVMVSPWTHLVKLSSEPLSPSSKNQGVLN